MSPADLWEDGYPHGTPAGYEGGCKGGACPAGAEHGLSCKVAKAKSSGDYQYQKLAKTGATPAEIADALGLVGTNPPITAKKPEAKKPSPATAKGAPSLLEAKTQGGADPAAADTLITDANDGQEAYVPTEAWAAAESSTVQSSEKKAKPTSRSVREKNTAIREWAIARGYVFSARGPIPKHIRAHYDEAHNNEPQDSDEAAEQLAEARRIRAAVGPMRNDDGTINASRVAQESTLRENAGLPSWLAELDAPAPEPDSDEAETDTSAAQVDTDQPETTTEALAADTDNAETVTTTYWELPIVLPEVATEQPADTDDTSSAPARPEWGYVTLTQDLTAVTAERDDARSLAARLWDELTRVETLFADATKDVNAVVARHRAALDSMTNHANELRQLADDRLRDLQAIGDLAQKAIALAEAERDQANASLQLVITKWGEAAAERDRLRAQPKVVQVTYKQSSFSNGITSEELARHIAERFAGKPRPTDSVFAAPKRSRWLGRRIR